MRAPVRLSAALLVSALALPVAGAYAQVQGAAKPQASKSAWKMPRTVDGQPDLQGNWTNATLTAISRPSKYKNLVMTAEEAKEIERTEADTNEAANKPTDPSHGIKDLPTDCGRGFTGVNCGYNTFWVDPGTTVMTINGEKRTSIITTADGRVPAMKESARQRMFARRRPGGFNDGPEGRSLGERCLMSFGSSAGPPMLPLLYNNNYQIVQSKDTVLILVEMVHDARVIRLNGKHKPASVRQWMGDSVGHWEGDTLVVETVNLRPDQGFSGASENAKYVERFTRVGTDQIVYQFTVQDPDTWDQPWGGEEAFNRSRDNLYEYACHEGNYALPGILAGAREEERAKAEKEKK
jgi:hypothetical protein